MFWWLYSDTSNINLSWLIVQRGVTCTKISHFLHTFHWLGNPSYCISIIIYYLHFYICMDYLLISERNLLVYIDIYMDFVFFLNIFSIAKNRNQILVYVQLLIQNYSRFCYVNWIHINTIRCYGACFITLYMEYKNICILQFINLINLYFDLIIWVLSISIRFLFADW